MVILIDSKASTIMFYRFYMDVNRLLAGDDAWKFWLVSFTLSVLHSSHQPIFGILNLKNQLKH